jgi:hypothetical protein
VEETWNPQMGSTMVGTFRLVTEKGPEFYELLLLSPEANSISYKVRHFNTDFTGWEEKDDFHTFLPVKITHDAIYFHGLTLQRDGDKCIHYLATRQSDGSHREVRLEYIRRENPVTPDARAFDSIAPAPDVVPLLLLGSYHMGNPGADMFNMKADDVTAPERQKEIQTLVDRLALWRPTKVAIEAPFGDSATIVRYQAYLRGDHALRKSEEEQIGFRLAKQLGHETIYPIDVQMGMDSKPLEPVIASDPAKFGPLMQELQVIGQAAVAQMGTWLQEGTIGSMLYKMNDPDLLDLSHAFYYRVFAPIISGSDYAGADLISGWYQRNLRIFTNLHQISDSPEDRIFVIYGQGHIPLLQQFADDSPYFRVDDVRTYLRGL